MFKTHRQQGRSERNAEAYYCGYVEALSDARTPLAAVFKIDQWRKWRIPVRIIAIPCSSAALTTSASLIDPPG